MSVDVSGQSIEWPLINRLVIEFIGCCGRTGGSWGGCGGGGGGGGAEGIRDVGSGKLHSLFP